MVGERQVIIKLDEEQKDFVKIRLPFTDGGGITKPMQINYCPFCGKGLREKIYRMNNNQAIKKLKELQTKCTNEEGNQAIDMAIKALKEQLKNEWIPVKNKLPKKNSYVLVCFDDGFVTGAEYEDDWELWADSGEVIAWKPVPKRYKNINVNQYGDNVTNINHVDTLNL